MTPAYLLDTTILSAPIRARPDPRVLRQLAMHAGRLVTAAFPFLVGSIVRSGTSPLLVLSWVAIAPLIGLVLLLAGLGYETRERA